MSHWIKRWLDWAMPDLWPMHRLGPDGKLTSEGGFQAADEELHERLARLGGKKQWRESSPIRLGLVLSAAPDGCVRRGEELSPFVVW